MLLDTSNLGEEAIFLSQKNTNLAINVFGWENDHGIVHRISEKDGGFSRIHLCLSSKVKIRTIKKRLSPLLCDQSKTSDSKDFCESCLHGYKTKDLLERHKPECIGLLKRPTRTELPKEEENKVSFTNYHKQIKAPCVIYEDIQSLLRKIHGCNLSKIQEESYTIKTEMHEACGFAYKIVRSVGERYG